MDLCDFLGFAIPLLGVIYFFPAFLASSRNHPHTRAIYAVTILFGWTFIGWAGAIIWAMTNTNREGARLRPIPRRERTETAYALKEPPQKKAA